MIQLIDDLKSGFEDAANDERALKMKAYMKNHFEFYGIPSPLRKELQKAFIKDSKKFDNLRFKRLIKTCWGFEQREWQYVAIDSLKAYKSKMDESFIDLIESLILTKSWWDTVDFLSSDIAGHLLKNYEKTGSIINKWIHSNELWLERSALLHQLKYKENINGKLLDKLIEIKKDDSEFFIQKAIGWSLRQYSKFDPAEVKCILSKYPELSSVAKREAGKYL